MPAIIVVSPGCCGSGGRSAGGCCRANNAEASAGLLYWPGPGAPGPPPKRSAKLAPCSRAASACTGLMAFSTLRDWPSGAAPMPIICCTVEGPAPRGPTVPGIIFIPGSIGTWPAVPGTIVAPGPLGPTLDASGPAPMTFICSKADWLLSREATASAAAVAVGPGGSSDALAEDTGLSALSVRAGDGTPLAANSDGVARPPGLYGLA